MAAILDRETGRVVYTREFHITPFILNVFPGQRDRYSTVIISSPDSPALPKLFQFVRNGYVDEDIVLASSLYDVKKQFSDLTQTDSKLRAKLALLDLSDGNQFAFIHPSIVPAPSRNWIDNHIFKNILIPNTMLQMSTPGDWSKNYSHTIWLAATLEDIPKVISDNAHITFIVDAEQAAAYLKQRIGIDRVVGDDIIFAVSSTLKADTQLMTLSKKRFLPRTNSSAHATV